MMYGLEKSDPVVVAGKPTNKAVRAAAEPVEPRTGTKGNADQQSTRRAQDRVSVSQALERVRQAARQRKKERFTALLHHISSAMLRTAFYAIKRDAAPGVDGMTWQTYERREATGDMIIVCYADDTVIGFEHEADARRFWDAMRERLREFSLTLHPDKTRLIEFGRHAARNRETRGLGKPETFTFLGFVLICGKSRRGDFQIRRKSRRDRMRAKLREIKEGLRQRWHVPIPETGKWLGQIVAGYFAYHAVPTNSAAIGAFHYHVTVLWHRRLCRRSQKAHLVWPRMAKLANDFLPKPRVLHPWPSMRFAVRHPR